jgi:hypothetical protein
VCAFSLNRAHPHPPLHGCLLLIAFAIQAAALGAELETCREGLERAGIDGMRLGGMGDAELAAVAASVGGRLHKDKLFDQLKGMRAVCEDQIATMRHFEE